jgi:large subunit ribosomal protein L22
MEVVATAKWVRVTARKARLVADSVKGLPVTDALTMLQYTPRHVSDDVAKVIKSAAANAQHNYNLDASTLRVNRVVVEDAVIIKRMRAKARGRMGSIFKRTSHLVAYLSDDLKPAATRRSGAAPATPRRRPAAKRAATAETAPETASEQEAE